MARFIVVRTRTQDFAFDNFSGDYYGCLQVSMLPPSPPPPCGDDDDDEDDDDDDDGDDDDEQIRHKQRARFYRRICNHGVGRGQHRYSTLIFLYAGIFYRE